MQKVLPFFQIVPKAGARFDLSRKGFKNSSPKGFPFPKDINYLVREINVPWSYFQKLLRICQNIFSEKRLLIRGIQTLDFSRKTTNAVLSDLQIVDVVK